MTYFDTLETCKSCSHFTVTAATANDNLSF